MAYSDARSRWLGCLLVIVLAFVLLLLPFIWLSFSAYTSAFPRPFDSQVWKSTEAGAWPEDNSRCAMLADLQFRIGVEGRSRKELIEMLGMPEKREWGEFWPLCPSFLDIWVMSVRWEDDRAVEVTVHDT
ncbi:MAG: hypothetical protein CL808_06565 [Citromicrobium sp.]|nr:hypothetical protein [Citromicrobium sp.]|tara:strand:+ start:136 stop:525 length:390 start_codon:yes stop_codon:yes gene_type:complete